MEGYYISINVAANPPQAVRQAVIDVMTHAGWHLKTEESAAHIVDDDNAENDGYGLFVSGAANGWVSVWVADWQDSGWLAQRISAKLDAAILEVWIAEDAHWGYTYFTGGDVRDRFADDASRVAETPKERELYVGNADALMPTLRITAEKFGEMLEAAREQAGQFPGGSIDALCEAVGLPFEHLFIAYEDFFSDDPEDYTPGLVGWPQFRHLAFTHPSGCERLSD